ncbi:GtrA family protein [Microvirga sp. 2YAF29]
MHRILQRANLWDWPLSRVMRVVRFALVGAASSGAYAVIMMVATSVFGLAPWVSSAVAYVLAMIINFPLQRSFTFMSKGDVRREGLKYLSVHLLNLLVSVAVVHLITQILQWPVFVSVAAVIIIIPLIQFLVLEIWVFKPLMRER